jgi:uncharacterized secreted protein with C-terminal beta-propeller domain
MLDWAAYWAVESQFYQYHARRAADAASRVEGAAPAAEKAAGGASPAQSGPVNHTKTNVQELGVDEADLVKTDGRHVYTVNGRDVVIVKSWPATRVHVVARYGLPAHVQPQSLFLEGDRLVVLSQVHEQLAAPPSEKRSGAAGRVRHPYAQTQNYFHGTRVTVLDIADRSRPRLVHEADIEGTMAQARMIGDDVYLVSNAPMSIPHAVRKLAMLRAAKVVGQVDYTNHERMLARKQRAYRSVRAFLDQKLGRASLVAAMPRQRHARPGGSMSSLRPLYACSDLLVPPDSGQLGTLNVVHFDIDDPARIDAVGVLASGWQIYASTDALYAAMPNYSWFHLWGWGAQPSRADYNVTNIHKFELRGEGDRPRYAATGRVRGHILNQFSMSEHDDHLRVATTDQAWGAGRDRSGNHLYVLAERGQRLVTVGAIEDLAPGERIYSARMMGDKGYMVTFKQTDPLFTLDLSNPRRPRVAGELKINGFSSYIHPLDDDHLLTVGQDATDEGRIQGAHVQVFDVSDPARPRRSAHRRIEVEGGWSASPAQWDHHAFTYDPRTRVLALPMMSSSFRGLAVLEVSKDSFVELGRISHADLIDRPGTCATGDGRVQPCPPPHHLDWRAQITRSIIMDDVIFSLSSLGLQVNALEQPRRTLARLLLARTQQSQER